ncbi:hypothetical protein [Roseisolibacter agri]|nr:hypothetical protein [Roseisolibacter agri]
MRLLYLLFAIAFGVAAWACWRGSSEPEHAEERVGLLIYSATFASLAGVMLAGAFEWGR